MKSHDTVTVADSIAIFNKIIIQSNRFQISSRQGRHSLNESLRQFQLRLTLYIMLESLFINLALVSSSLVLLNEMILELHFNKIYLNTLHVCSECGVSACV